MLNQKQTYILILILLLFPSSVVYSAWSEPSQAPTGGNAAVPLYSEGSGQTLNGTLSVDPAATNAFPLQANGSDTGVLGTGVLKGLQGNSPATAVFGNLSSNAAIGDKAVYGLAVDPNDYSASFSGGLGVDVASGDIRFRSRGPGIAWPRVLDEVPLAGLSVSSGGELRLYAHGGGINFFDQNLVSRLTVSEVGAVNVVTPIAQGGALKLNNVNVCLSDGTNCPAPPPPPAGSNLWLPNGNDIYPNFSGAVKLNHDLQFNGDTAANAVIDFDPWEGNLGNYFLIQSGISPTYGLKQHLRINRNGEALLGGNLFIGKGGSVASMTPYNDPTANVSWKVGLVGGVSTIEAEPGPGGNPGGRGDLNLKTGILSAGTVNLSNDIKVADGGAFGGFDPDATYKVTTPSLFTQSLYDSGGLYADQILVGAATGSYQGTGKVNARELCINGSCKSDWTDSGIGAGPGGWTDVGATVQLTASTDIVSLGQTLNSTNLSDFFINGNGNVQISIDTNGGPLNNNFKIVNDQDNPVFSVDEWGYVSDITSIKVNGAVTIAPLAVKTDTAGGVLVECSLGGCGNKVILEVRSAAYGVIKTSDGSGVGTALILQPNPAVGVNGGKVGIGTTAPNALLHLKTNTGNAELDIQSASSPYWGIYQDDGTDELRFFHNLANRMVLFPSGHVGIGPAGVASEQDIPLYVDSAGGLMGIGIYTDGTIVAGQTVSALRLQMTNGAGAGKVLTSNATGLAGWSTMLPASAYPPYANDLGNNDADTEFINVPNPPPGQPPYFNYVCQAGWVMIGIRSETSSSKIICGKLW